MKSIYSLLLCVGLVPSCITCYTPYQMDIKVILPIQEQYTEILSTYIDSELERLSKIEDIFLRFSDFLEMAEANAAAFVDSRFGNFMLIKYLTKDMENFLKTFLSGYEEQYFERVKALQMPTDYLYEVTATSLTWYHVAQNFSDSELIPYFSETEHTGVQLAAQDCIDLGLRAYDISHHKGAIFWMEKALQKLDADDDDYLADKKVSLEHLAYSYSMDGQLMVSLTTYREVLKLFINDVSTHRNIAKLEKVIASNKSEFEVPPGRVFSFINFSEDLDQYTSLCKGEEHKSAEEQRHLTCRYFTNDHPFLLIQPVKEEEMNLEPRVVVYHKVMQDNEVEMMRELAEPKLGYSQTYRQPANAVVDVRISKSAWIEDKEHYAIKRLSQRIEAITGLDVNFTEPFQVAHYGIGGFYRLHPDFVAEEQKFEQDLIQGDRIATWISYINHVEQGGFTVFPAIQTIIRPEKGSAVFWYNLYSNGSGNFKTVHAGCPVVKGTKWIANKWFRERGQEFLKPCTLSKLE